MRVIALIGAMGAGKSTIAEKMAAKLGDEWEVLSIDQERAEGGDWRTLVEKVKHLKHPAIIESVLLPPVYRAALREHDTTIIKVWCTERERRRRLSIRGEHRVLKTERTLSHMKFDATVVTEQRIDRLVELARTRNQRRLIEGMR